MDELRVLVDMVAALPALAIWVLVAFYAYKVIIIGSIYGVIRFTVQKLHDWLVTTRVKHIEIRPMLDGICIAVALEALIGQIQRIKNKGRHTKMAHYTYIHADDVAWLRQAIDEKIERDLQQEKAKTA